MSTVIDIITGEGFTSIATQEADGRVHFIADADVDADGANGQHGKQAAYMVGDKGSEYLANGGMAMRDGKVIGATSWFKDIVILGKDGQPKVSPGGIIASKTAYKTPGMSKDDPAAYIDSETYPYIVVSPSTRNKAKGIVLGCLCKATNRETGRSSFGGVVDIGPKGRNGEVSIEMARLLGLNPNPRNGGTDRQIILYEFWPGTPAEGLKLIPA